MSHLFTIPHEFAAVPDVGWPDIFNSGVLVFTPGEEKFKELTELLKSKGSWDGGDQGILNEWRGDAWHRLSFTYNTTPTAVYTYVRSLSGHMTHTVTHVRLGTLQPTNVSVPRYLPSISLDRTNHGFLSPTGHPVPSILSSPENPRTRRRSLTTMNLLSTAGSMCTTGTIVPTSTPST